MNQTHENKPLGESRKAVLRQILMVFLGNLGVIGGGMILALPSATLADLTNKQNFNLEEGSWYSSIAPLAFVFGALLVWNVLDPLGRKMTLILTNLIGVIGWTLTILAPYNAEHNAIYIQILVGRFIMGIMVGLIMSPAGIYAAEISLPKMRGRLAMGPSIGLGLGIWLIYVLGYFIRNDWNLICQICGAYQVLSLILLFPMPESPIWLMQKGRFDIARRSLEYFRGLSEQESISSAEFEEEFLEMRKTSDAQHALPKESLLKAIKSREVYCPILLMIGLFVFQQGSGFIVVIVLSLQIAERAGVAMDTALVAVMLGGCRVVATFFVGSIFDKWGRKPAGMISAAGMAICMYLLAISTWFPIVGETIPLLSVIALIMYITISTMGLLTLPFFLLSEVFPQRVRGSAAGLTLTFNFLLSFVVLKTYPSLEALMGAAGIFAFYGTASFLAVFYMWLFLPETRGRTLSEIEEYFRTGREVSKAEIALRRLR